MSRAWTKQPTRSDTLELLWVVVCQLYRLEHVNFLAVGAADVRTTLDLTLPLSFGLATEVAGIFRNCAYLRFG